MKAAVEIGPFTGFPKDALAFYRELEADNTRTFWLANKPRYDGSVKAPLLALCESMPAAYKPFHVFRPNRDVRFGKDKTPYKNHAGAVSELEGGSSLYVQFSKDGLYIGGGYYQMAGDQLERYRAAVDHVKTGPALAKVVASATAAGLTVASFDALKTAPKGYAKDHSRIELLRRKGLHVGKELGSGAWLATPAARDKVIDVWKGVKPVFTWLDKNVGPSTEPPDDRWGR
jgi:uncharacterized protein (TIGR02453 family)